MPRFHLALFDFDGTLADSFPWFTTVIDELATVHGFRRPDPAEIPALRGLESRAILKRLGVPMWKLPAIAGSLRRLAARDAGGIPLFDGVDAMLRRLSASGLRLAVVSSNAEDNVRRVLGPVLADLIDCYACGAALLGKPAKFRRVMKRLQVGPDQAIAIGDEARDIDAAQQVGIASLAVGWGYADMGLLRSLRPTMTVERVADIPGLLGA